MFPRTFKIFKESYTGHPRQIWTLAALTFINRLGTMVMPFLTLYLTTVLHYSFKEAGFLAGCFGLGSVAGSYLGGRLTDKLGPNTVIFSSLIFGGITLISIQWASSFFLIALVVFLAAFLGEGYRPAVMVSVRRFVPKSETGRSISLIRLAINLGFSASPAIGGFVAISLGYHALFWIDGITCILAAFYFIYRARKWPAYQPPAKSVEEQNAPPVIQRPYQNRSFLWLLVSIMFMGFAIIQWFQSVPVFMKTEWHLDERYYGMIMALNGLLIVFLEVPLIHNIERRGGIKKAIYIGIILTGVSFLPLLLPAALIWCVISMVFFSVGEILFMPLVNSIALNMSPDERSGEYMAWFSMTWSTMHILGPSIGLPFIDAVGFSAFWLLIAVVTSVSLIISLRLLPKV